MGNIRKIVVYNTQRISDQESLTNFVARKKELKSLLSIIHSTQRNNTPQHQLIIGQRGMGKTTLLKRLEVEIRRTPLNERFIPLLFPEEQYNLDSLATFWLNCLDAIADIRDIQGAKDDVQELDDEIDRLTQLSDIADRTDKAYQFFCHTTFNLGRRPVLLIDNIDLVFKRLNQDELHVLRAYLTESGAPLVIGASSSPVVEAENYESPFYDAFQIHFLKKLSSQDLLEMMKGLAKNVDSSNLSTEISRHRARLKAINQLTGGNPRTAIMLFNQVMKGFSDTIVEDLDLILDELTPIYKARYEELSEKQQIIINAVAMHWDPLSLDKIREITGLDAGQLSPQLKRLSETGWIEKPLYEKRKGGAYELSERMFNIWYLMRRSSRRQKKGVFCLSKYLEAFYENEDELQGWIVRYISVPLTTKHHAITALALAKLSSDKDLRWRLHEQSIEYIKTNPDFIQNIDATDLYDSIEESTQAFIDASKHNDTQQILITTESLLSNPVLSQLNIYEDVVINRTLALMENGQLNEAIDLMNNNAQIKFLAPIWVELATIVHNNKGPYEDVKIYLEQAIKVDNACGEAYIFLGKLYTELGDERNAIWAFDKASTLYKTEPLELTLAKGILSVLFKGVEDPETKLKMVLSQESDNKEALFYLGCHLFYSKKDNYGLDYFKELKKLDPQNITVDVWLFVIYQILDNPDLANQLLDGRQNEKAHFYRGVASIYSVGDMPENAYKYWVKAVEEDERDLDSMTRIVIYCLSGGYYDEAVLYIEKILTISPNDPDGLYLGGIAYLMQGNLDRAKMLILSSLKKEPTERMYSLLGRLNEQKANYEEAKECYQKALKLNGNKNIYVLEKLGELNRDIFKDYVSSENSFLQIKDENPYLLISLYRDYMNRVDDAKKLFEGFELTNNNTEYELEKILFLIHDSLMDEARKLFSILMERLREESSFPKYSDAFIRFYSSCIRCGKGQWLLEELDILNLREELAPDYHAIAAIVSNNPEAYLDTVALEIREISMTIVSRMMRRL